MKNSNRSSITLLTAPVALALLLLLGGLPNQQPTPTAHTASYIVQAQGVEAAAELVKSVGGQATQHLAVIAAVVADLEPQQVKHLESLSGSHRIFRNDVVRAAARGGGGGGGSDETDFPALIDADVLHALGIFGRGVRIAFIDTYIPGFSWIPGLYTDSEGNPRGSTVHYSSGDPGAHIDHGHSTHVMGVAASSLETKKGKVQRYRAGCLTCPAECVS